MEKGLKFLLAGLISLNFGCYSSKNDYFDRNAYEELNKKRFYRIPSENFEDIDYLLKEREILRRKSEAVERDMIGR